MKLRVKTCISSVNRNLAGKIIVRKYYYTVQVRHHFFFWKSLRFELEKTAAFYGYISSSETDNILSASKVYCYKEGCPTKFHNQIYAEEVIADIICNPNKYLTFNINEGR